MCKCKRESRDHAREERWESTPYCNIGDCKPSEKFILLQKDCPWKGKRVRYIGERVQLIKDKDKVYLCKGAGSDSHEPSCHAYGKFLAPWWCCEENCAPYHFMRK